MTPVPSPLDVQVGGNHYKEFSIQPVEFIEANRFGFLTGCMIKRICRFDRPTGKGIEDLKKVAHEIELFLHMRGECVQVTSDLMPGAFSLDNLTDEARTDACNPIPVTVFVETNGFADEPRGSLLAVISFAEAAGHLGHDTHVVLLMSAAWITVVGMLRLAGVDIQTGGAPQ